MRLALVVPRYGPSVLGGAETLVRGYAERLAAAGHGVEVITSCATDHHTWSNALPVGETRVAGVRVRRFPVTRARDIGEVVRLHAQLDAGARLTPEEERTWVLNTGYSEPMLDAIGATADDVDALLFAPYLFASTVFGARVRPERSLIIPCLHDESFARFGVIQDTLRSAAGLIFLTRAEGALATRLLGEQRRSAVSGAGFDPPANIDGARALRRHRLRPPIVTYAGRREGGKNFPLVVRWLTLHGRALAPDHAVTLAALGSGPEPIPATAREVVADLGMIDERDKYDVFAASLAVCNLSLNESFSYVLMEAWLAGTTTIVHADCAVTREHCEESGGGLWVSSAEELSEALVRLQRFSAERDAMAEAGCRYVLDRYTWPAVIGRVEAAVRDLLQ